jgi:hypothetical protein
MHGVEALVLAVAVLVGAYAVFRLVTTVYTWHVVHCCRCADRVATLIKTQHAAGSCQPKHTHWHHGVEVE